MANDTLQLEMIYAEHRQKVYLYLSRLVGEKDAEDLTQDVFIKVGQALDSFKNQAKLSTWIYQIATNAAMDRLRSRSYKQDMATSYEAEPTTFENQPLANAPALIEDQLVRNEMNECIHAYIDVLPEKYRMVLVLSEIEGLKNSEIAAILGLSLNAVKIRLHRAKEKLKEELAANCIFYRTDCNQLACEPKGPFKRKLKPLAGKKPTDN